MLITPITQLFLFTTLILMKKDLSVSRNLIKITKLH